MKQFKDYAAAGKGFALAGSVILLGTLNCAYAASNATMNISVTIEKQCTITVEPVTFDVKSKKITNGIETKAPIKVSCTKGTDYKLTADNGKYANNTMRRMKSGTDFIDYTLNIGDKPFGEGSNGFDQKGKDVAVKDEITDVVAKIVPGQNPPAGTYEDTVNIKLEY